MEPVAAQGPVEALALITAGAPLDIAAQLAKPLKASQLFNALITVLADRAKQPEAPPAAADGAKPATSALGGTHTRRTAERFGYRVSGEMASTGASPSDSRGICPQPGRRPIRSLIVPVTRHRASRGRYHRHSTRLQTSRRVRSRRL
jgi:hypothetical protein